MSKLRDAYTASDAKIKEDEAQERVENVIHAVNASLQSARAELVQAQKATKIATTAIPFSMGDVLVAQQRDIAAREAIDAIKAFQKDQLEGESVSNPED